MERGGGRGKNGTHHKCILNEGREEKIEGMSLGLGGRLDGGGRGRGGDPTLIKHFVSVLGEIFDDKTRENALSLA